MSNKLALLTSLFAALQLFYPEAGLAQSNDTPHLTSAWPTSGWESSTPEAQGMDSAKLAVIVEALEARHQDSLMVIRHGKIVTEAYYAPYVVGVPHDLRSVTKSVIGTLTAIEIKNGQLDTTDRSVVELFSDKSISGIDTDEKKKAIRVQNLLDMNSGVRWKEAAYTPDETVMQMLGSRDRVEFFLNQPMATQPSTRFSYNSGNPYLLSALINKKTGQNAFELAKIELFAPLGITSAWWGRADDKGIIDGGSGLFLTPQDMAKIGYLYLHDGMWDGRQIIPEAWVKRAKEGPVRATGGLHYANLWWSLPEKGAFMALGRHSQMILVLPKLDIVAVTTGSIPEGEFYSVAPLIDALAETVKSDAPISPDPISQSLLSASILKAAIGTATAISNIPDVAKTISGKVYQLTDNAFGVKTIMLDFSGADCLWRMTITGKPGQPLIVSEGHVGLDGTFRNGPPAQIGPSAVTAARGRWLNSRTFEVEHQILGHGETQNVQFSFDGDRAEVIYRDTDGATGRAFGKPPE